MFIFVSNSKVQGKVTSTFSSLVLSLDELYSANPHKQIQLFPLQAFLCYTIQYCTDNTCHDWLRKFFCTELPLPGLLSKHSSISIADGLSGAFSSCVSSILNLLRNQKICLVKLFIVFS